MRHVVAAMIRSLPQIGSILALLIVVSYISAVIVTHLYGVDYPELFGTIGRSMLTLLQLMTLEGWAAEVVRPVMETHPYSVFLFIPYMLMTAFAILNLFTAVLVDSMQILQQNYTRDRAEESTVHAVTQEMLGVKADLQSLTNEVKALNASLNSSKKQDLHTISLILGTRLLCTRNVLCEHTRNNYKRIADEGGT
jgi:voltage-gated sodium channel